MTHLEALQNGLAIVQAREAKDGKVSRYGQDLRGQIAAAKEAMGPLPHGETQWFGSVVLKTVGK